MVVPRSRLLDLMKANGVRMGNKILRQRLRGPSLVKYYPPRGPDLNTLARDFKDYGLRSRGKGAPKKKKGPPGAKK
ncbi:hypothetical protein DL769_010583 [Monosporascus sp. CRB-8-3]|nr:hypothetical protein DL769_010583 [Monosporascus sp. CRB-8-3]